MSVYRTCVVTLDFPYTVELSRRNVPATFVLVSNEAVALMVTFTMTGTPSDRSPPDGRTLLIFAVIGTLVGRDRTSATAFVGTSSSRATGSLMLVLKATGNPV